MLSSLKVCGDEISLCQAGFLEVPTLAWSRWVHPRLLEHAEILQRSFPGAWSGMRSTVNYMGFN